MRILKSGHGSHQRILNVKGQTGRNAVRVILVRRQPLRLQEDLMAFLVRKPVNLVFHTGAISRANAFNLAREHRTAIETGANNVMCALVRMGHPARHLSGMLLDTPHETERRHARTHAARHAVAGLLNTLAEINSSTIKAWRCACLQPALRQLQFLQSRT